MLLAGAIQSAAPPAAVGEQQCSPSVYLNEAQSILVGSDLALDIDSTDCGHSETINVVVITRNW